jgi:hypothetical protein
MLTGSRKSRIPFFEYRVHSIPADKQPIEIKIKYNARSADIVGYADQNEVSKNQIPGIRNKNNNVILLCEANRESELFATSDSGLVSLGSTSPE